MLKSKKLIKEQIRTDQLAFQLKNRMAEAGFKENNQAKLEEFVNANYDLLTASTETMPAKVLVKNYIDFLKTSKVNESFSKKILREAESDSVEELDKIGLVQDLADIQGSLYDSFSRLYQYKDQYSSDKRIQGGIVDARVEISTLIGKLNNLLKSVSFQDSERF